MKKHLYSRVAPITTSFSSSTSTSTSTPSQRNTPHTARRVTTVQEDDDDASTPLLQEDERQKDVPLAGRQYPSTLLFSLPFHYKYGMSTRTLTEKGILSAGDDDDATSSLSFWQRHFCRPLPDVPAPTPSTRSSASSFSNNDSTRKPIPAPTRPRRFSIRSRGSILVILILLMLLIASAVVAIALTLTKHSIGVRHQFPQPHDSPHVHPVDSSNSSEVSESMAYSFSDAPIRLGILENFPDPSIYYDTDSKLWYAMGTNDAAGILRAPNPDASTEGTARANIQVATSPDFEHWSLLKADSDPLATLGAWVDTAALELEKGKHHDEKLNPPTDKHRQPPGVAIANVWAPDVLQRPSDKQYILYYSALDTQHHTHCLGAATSASIAGPYKPEPTPFACPFEIGGAIDPVGFIDTDPATNASTIYVIYKVDGNSRGHGGECGNTIEPIVSTPLMLQKMQDDGITPDGPAIQILDRVDADGPLVEAPALAKVDETYFLFYSSGCTKSPDYTVRYATAKHIAGPYVRAKDHGRLLQTGDSGLLAPGSVSVRFAPDVRGDEIVEAKGASGGGGDAPGTWKMALHGRVDTTEGGVRAMFTAGLEFEGAVVRVVRVVNSTATSTSASSAAA
ncbi:MAG: hypothetical protein M1828_003616 [Chrysothrix sp. TS-e1954]|nr:MAG: hypothetical protein M1828_003616 [Chrysothrix sp. TS-e1954]